MPELIGLLTACSVFLGVFTIASLPYREVTDAHRD